MTTQHGWCQVRIEDLAENDTGALTDGPFGSNLKTSHYTAEGPRVIRLQNIGEGAFYDERAHIALEHFASLRKHEARAGDVVVAMLGEALPRACVVPRHVGPAIVKADCVRLRVDSRLALPPFVAAGLNSDQVRRQASSLMHGVGRPRLGLGRFRDLEFPLAPLTEQRHIVDSLDSYFSRLDEAAAALERVRRNLKRYRAAVLHAAVEGRLVPTEADLARAEGRTYEPASELLKRILAERRRRWEEAELSRWKAAGKTPKDDKWKEKYEDPIGPAVSDLPALPQGWCWATLDQLSLLVRNGFSKAPDSQTGIPILRISAVRPLTVDLGDIRYLRPPISQYTDYLVEAGDLLFTRYNGTRSLVGVVGVVGTLTHPLVHPDKLIRVRLVPLVMPRYVELAANTGESRLHLERLIRTTAGQSGVSGGDLKRMPLPVPPRAEQSRIEGEANRRLSVAEECRLEAGTAVARAARLRQAILKWAFEGKLVDQDPNDEPASVLLDRIRAERAAQGTADPRRGAKKARRAHQRHS